MATSLPSNRASFSALQVVTATQGDWLQRSVSLDHAVGVVTDSRHVTQGALFVAFRGEQSDGHDFLHAAAGAGASLLLVEQGRGGEYPPGVDIVAVPNTVVALGQLARAHLQRWREHGGGGKVLGITGSSGKTTTKELCALLLSSVAETHATCGNLNNRIGLPLVALATTPAHRFLVAEMGMSEPGEITALAEIAEPDVGVLLNVGVAHAEGVGGGQAAIAHEKGALLQALPPEGYAVVNRDDAWAYGARLRSRAKTISFGVSPHADYRLLERVSQGAEGSHVVFSRPGLTGEGERCAVFLPLPGEVAALDFLAALAAAEMAWGGPLPLESVAHALTRCKAMPGRVSPFRLWNGALLLDDSYNANPSSMQAALNTLHEIGQREGRQTVAVLGEMRELGPFALEAHRALGGQLVEKSIQLGIGCGGLVTEALEVAQRGGVAVCATHSPDEALEQLLARLSPQDIVLVKGSFGVGTWRLVDALKARG